MEDESLEMELPRGEILVYRTDDGQIRIETRMQNETIWLTINQMAKLFGVDKSGVSRHLKNIFETGELQREATVAKFATVQNEGGRSVSRDLEYYNLDAIISVGYRVNSIRGTQFRIWATERLKEYIVKGFTMDDERLKEPSGSRYFQELLARIRDIRSSEKIFWRKVLDIYAQGEVAPESTIRKFRIVQIEGKREVSRTVDFYNLDAIISVGYRVNSVRATHFRQWATRVLREFVCPGSHLDLEKGFAFDSC
jgi:hypothetical protein